MLRTRITAVVTVLLLSVSLAAVAPKPCLAQTEPIAEDMGRLLPAGTDVLIVVRSIDRVDRKWQALVETVAPSSSDSPGPLDWLEREEDFAGVLKFAALDRPWVLALHPPREDGEEFEFTLVSALQDPTIADAALHSVGDLEPHRDGELVAYSSLAEYEAGNERHRLLKDVPVGDIVLRADAQALVERYRPALESWLGEMSDSAASPSSRMGTVLLNALEPLFDSARALDITLLSEDDGVSLGCTLDVVEGSPLDPPRKQPSREDSIRLARALPRHGGFSSVSALDVTPLGELWAGMLDDLLGLSPATGEGPDPHVVQAFLTRLLEIYELSNRPWAAWFDIDLTGIHAVGAVRVDDAPAWLTRLAEIALEAEDYDLGYRMIEIDPPVTSLEGMRSFRVEMDPEALTEDLDEDAKASVGPALGVIDALLPPIHLVAEDDLLAFAMEREAGPLENYLASLDDIDRSLPSGLVAAFDWAGEARSVSVWDLRGIVSMLGMFGGGGAVDPDALERLEQTVFVAADVDKSRYDFRVRVDVPAVALLIDTFRSMGGGAPSDGGSAEAPVVEAATLSTMTSDEAQALADEVSGRVEEIRHLEFESPVVVRIVDDEIARTHFLERLDKFLPEDLMADQEAVYADLGILESEGDLEEILLDLLREQAGGYYDPQKQTMFLLDDMPRATAPILLAHELTHALDDQHFRIDASLEAIPENNDEQTAFTAVVEGSGTLVMTVYLMNEMMSGDLSMDALTEFQESEAGKAESLTSAPSVLQRALLGPYILGNRFLLRGDIHQVAGGVVGDDIDHAFAQPPVSTEQVLHPEKYWNPEAIDLPRVVESGEIASLLGTGWTLARRGTLGELEMVEITGAPPPAMDSMALLQGEGWTNDAASGWGGDQWTLLRRGEQTMTVLATVWDTSADAIEFEAALELPLSAVIRREDDAVVVVAGEAEGATAARVADVVLDRVLSGE